MIEKLNLKGYILYHVDIWQKTTQICKAIILQLKNKQILKNNEKKDIYSVIEVLIMCTIAIMLQYTSISSGCIRQTVLYIKYILI